MTRSSGYNVPYHWWGPGPAPAVPLTLRELIQRGVVDVDCAAKLSAVLAQRRSLIVVGGPSGLGKSTLLHALLPSLPEGTGCVYLRGCHETFAFRDDPELPPTSTALLANEISPHLPIYLWGPAVRRTLEAGAAGFQILATAHGRSVVEFAASLTGSPLRIPARALAAFGLISLIEPDPGNAGRRVAGLWQLSATRDGVSIDHLDSTALPEGVSPDQFAASLSAILELLSQG